MKLLKIIVASALGASVFTVAPTNAAPQRILHNYQQNSRKIDTGRISTQLFEKILKLYSKKSGKDMSASLTEKFPWFKFTNLRNCVSIDFERAASNNPVENHPEVLGSYICSPEKSLVAFHIKDAGKEALYIVDPFTLTNFSNRKIPFPWPAHQAYYLTTEIFELDDGIDYEQIDSTDPCHLLVWDQRCTKSTWAVYSGDTAWAGILLRQLLDPSLTQSDPIKDYGLDLKWCDMKCLYDYKKHLEDNNIYIPRARKSLFDSSTGAIVVINTIPGSTAAEVECFPRGAFIIGVPYGQKFTSLDDLKRHISKTSTKGSYDNVTIGSVKLVALTNDGDFKSYESSNNSCSWVF
jgi:hypothetical protein